eukprot:TRINITY_DN2011_c0_g1_i3.p1 TRINITY_DN2011_c0_g1~~TRINITY_DN2011_c0_g1_i3.p1  ORF type:complete len:301 (-),score=54.34 TRINITY_DN2011_c0_g1_i3:6-908(-)
MCPVNFGDDVNTTRWTCTDCHFDLCEGCFNSELVITEYYQDNQDVGEAIEDSGILILPGNVPILLVCIYNNEDNSDTNIHNNGVHEAVKLLRTNSHSKYIPYIVTCTIVQNDCDLNMEPGDMAYHGEEAQTFYELFHQKLSETLSQMYEKYQDQDILLLDFHGSDAYGEAIISNTLNGSTCSDLIQKYGEAVVNGNNSLFGNYSKFSRAIPAIGVPLDAPRIFSSVNGDYIIKQYSGLRESSDKPVACIQVLLGSEVVQNSDSFSRDFYRSLIAFSKSLKSSDFTAKDTTWREKRNSYYQ